MPTTTKAGEPIHYQKFYQTREDLVARFGALSTSPELLQGIWLHNGTRYEDQSQRIVIDVEDNEENRAFFTSFKTILQERFDQIEIYIVSYLIDRI